MPKSKNKISYSQCLDYLLMIMPIVFITLIGDFPKNDGNMLFCVQRTWRVNWLLGQMLFLVMSSLTFMLGVILSTFLAAAGHLQWSEQWSATVTDYSSSSRERR